MVYYEENLPMMRGMKCAMTLGFGVWIGAVAVQAGAQATLTIETGKPVAKVSPMLYGLMTEEINYSYDGGLYGELVQDRTFLSRGSDTENRSEEHTSELQSRQYLVCRLLLA